MDNLMRKLKNPKILPNVKPIHPRKSESRIQGTKGNPNEVALPAHVEPHIPRKMPRTSTRTEEKPLPNPDISNTRANPPGNNVTAKINTPTRRPVNPQQDAGGEMRPEIQRRPTTQSFRERSSENASKLLDDVSQIDTDVPHPLPQLKNETESSSVYNEDSHDPAAARYSEQLLANSTKAAEKHVSKEGIDLNDLAEVHSECNMKIAALEAQLRKEKEMYNKLSQTWKKQSAALAQAQQHEANYKIDDGDLKGLYQQLIFMVVSWADNYCISDMKQLSHSDIQPLCSVTTVYQKFLNHKSTQPLLLKSLVMKMLVDEIFTISAAREGGAWWAGERAQEMRKLYGTLKPGEPFAIPALLQKGALRSIDVKNYSQWKAKSALLLSQRFDDQVMDSCIITLMSRWLKILAPMVEKNNDRVWEDFEEIIQKTIILDLEMGKSRALFAVQPWSIDDLERLDPTKIEAAAGFEAVRPGMKVELLLAPCLTKTGSADGAAFETMAFISKWIVVTRDNRKHITSAPKTD